MTKTMRVGIVLIFFISLAAFLVSWSLYQQKADEKRARLDAEKRLESEMESRRVVERDLEKTRDLQQKAEQKVLEKQNQVAGLEAEAQQLRRRENELLASASQRDQQVDRLQSELAELRAHKDNLSNDIDRQRKEAEELKRQLGEIRQAKEALEARFDRPAVPEGGKGVELEPIVVKVQPSSLSGRVLVVNKEFNFVITNLGKRDELALGDSLEVVREERAVAKVQVEKLYESMSAATILPEGRPIDIQEGDYVRKL